MVPVGELHLLPLASLDCCGTSLPGMPSWTPVPASVTIFQPTFSRRRFAVSASTPRSCGLSTPVCLPPRAFWNSLIAATMRSLTSPVITALYWPTQARSDCSASRSPCASALAVSAGVCIAGRIGVVATVLGLVPAVEGAVICASAGSRAEAININVAVSIDLMTNRMTNLAPLKRGQLSTSDWSAIATRWFKEPCDDLENAVILRCEPPSASLEGWHRYVQPILRGAQERARTYG